MARLDDNDNDRDERYDRRRPPKKSNATTIVMIVLAVVFLGGGLVAVGGYFALNAVRESAHRSVSSNNLKQIGLAYHSYHDANGVTVSDTYGPDGKPLLSWRVYLLPYIEADNLYRQFKLNEPWDSPNNIQLLQRMPAVYANPQDRSSRNFGTKTYYRAFTHPGTPFARRVNLNAPIGMPIPQGPGLGEFKDGVSNTILIVEAGEAVEWTKPDDFDGSEGKPFPKLGGLRPGSSTFAALMADGSVIYLKRDMPEDILRKALTHAGNDPVSLQP